MALRVAVGVSSNPEAFRAGQEAVQKALEKEPISKPGLVIVFSPVRYAIPAFLQGIRSVTGPTPLVGCTDAGGITKEGPNHKGVTVMLLESDDIEFVIGCAQRLSNNAIQAGRNLGHDLLSRTQTDKPMQVAMMFPDGLRGNGADIVRGLQEALGPSVPIVGGAAGDDFLFKTTYQYYNDQVLTDTVPGILFRGNMNIGIGVRHGWKPLGIPRTVTKAKDNVLYELEGKPAIRLYEEYFGKSAEDLKKEPFAQMAITYPIGMSIPEQEEYLIRDPITVQEDGSIVCAAEVREGSKVRLMIGSTESALQAARTAAQQALEGLGSALPRGAVVFNCIARDKMFGKKAPAEIQIIHETLGKSVEIAGFYTYGEQAPGDGKGAAFTCHFHNETVVIFLFGQ